MTFEERRFESTEAMIEWMAQVRAEVDARPLAAAQEAITWGDHAVRFYEDLVVFAQVETRDSLDSEDFETRAAIVDRFEADHLWCKCYSTIVPNGEYGYLHRSVLWPIPARTFVAAMASDWEIERMPGVDLFQIETALHDHRAFLARVMTEGGSGGS